MKHWRFKIHLAGFYDAEPEDFKTLAQVAIDQLEKLRSFPVWDEELGRIQDDFHTAIHGEDVGVEDFDFALRALYEWGDKGKRLWVGVSRTAPTGCL